MPVLPSALRPDSRKKLMKFHTRVLSGARPLRKLLRDAEQIAKFVYARSNVRAVEANRSSDGVCMYGWWYETFKFGRRSSAMRKSTFLRGDIAGERESSCRGR